MGRVCGEGEVWAEVVQAERRVSEAYHHHSFVSMLGRKQWASGIDGILMFSAGVYLNLDVGLAAKQEILKIYSESSGRENLYKKGSRVIFGSRIVHVRKVVFRDWPYGACRCSIKRSYSLFKFLGT
jgi:hypothetical protein